MGKKKSSETKSYSGSGQQWATPYATSAVQDVKSVVNQNQPGLQELTDLTRNNVVNPLLGKFNAGLGTAGAANGYYGDVLNGKYLSGNPYMGQVIRGLNDQVSNDANSHFNLSGRYGSFAHGQGIGKALADADGQLMYQNYSDEMSRMGQAADAAQRGSAADTAALISAIGTGAQIPYTGTSNLANSLGALFSGGTSTGVTYSPNPLLGAAGAGLGALGMIFQGKG